MDSTIYKIKKYIHEQKIENKKWIIFNTLNFNYLITDTAFSTLSFENISNEVKSKLFDLGFLSFVKEEVLFKEKAQEWETNFRDNYKANQESIDFLIVPTLGCNFRCSYCYQPPIFGKETREETHYIESFILNAFFNYIDRHPELLDKKLHLRICGGEVFLDDKRAYDFIEELMHNSKRYPIVEILFVTNGYHIDKFLPLLKDFKNISYSITIDGPSNIHNSRRFLETGEGTFNQIFENINLIVKNTDHKIIIRTNFDVDNIYYLPEYFSYLQNKELLTSKQISLYFRPVFNYTNNEEKSEEYTAFIPDRKAIIYAMLDIYFNKKHKFKLHGAHGFFLFLLTDIFLGDRIGRHVDAFSDPLKMFCSANQGYFSAVDHTGKVFPCYGDNAESIGIIYPKINIDEKFVQKWNSTEFLIREFYKEPCRSCKYFFMCTLRQCPLNSFETFDDEKKYCTEIYEGIKYFFDYFGEKIWKHNEKYEDTNHNKD